MPRTLLPFRQMCRLGVIVACSLAATHARADLLDSLDSLASWTSGGANWLNTRSQLLEFKLNRQTAPGLATKWALTVDSDATATPAVEGDFLYFPDVNGSLYKVNRRTGALVWKHRISEYTGIAADFARATPAIAGNSLILGNQNGKNLEMYGQPAPVGARVFAVDKNTGKLLWNTKVDPTVRSMVTSSAVIAKGLAIVGVASNEELVAGIVTKAPAPPGYPANFGSWKWEFRGSIVALDVRTGAIKWQTYTVPQGYFGGSVWAGTGAVDYKRNQVYMASGDNFWAPESVQACVAAALAKKKDPQSCQSPDDHYDSIIAMDLDTGRINWAQRGIAYDTWNVGCGLFVPGFNLPPNDNCPNPKGPDWDFAQGPILITNNLWIDDDDLVGAGQKSGVFWAFHAKDGKPAWNTQVAPGGLTGGLQWGSAYDGERIYVAASNAGPILGNGQDSLPWKLLDGSTTTAGGWAALDPRTGKLLWTTADPFGGRAEGPVSVAAGVVYGCDMEYNPANPALGAGRYFALDSRTGKPIWSSPTLGSCNAGASIVDGMVYWGGGTNRGTVPTQVFGFGLP